MGIEKNDSLWGFQTPERHVSVEDFLMDPTEVTNAMYKEFVNDITSAIIEERKAIYGSVENAKNSLYIINKVTGEKRLDPSQIIYAYQQYDYLRAAAPEYQDINPDSLPMITKDTAYIDDAGKIVCERLTRPYTGDYDFLNTYIVNIYPDTLCWVKDFPDADMEMYYRYYFSHPDYNNYPVVGVTWEQAKAYCAWRTEQMKKKLGDKYGDTQPYRLPTEAEWEHAARGRQQNRFPWESYDKDKGEYYANFMVDEGNYADDGNIITSHVGSYLPNEYGLYDMAGNVAEWTSTAYSFAGVADMNNVNPINNTNNPTNTKKVVRGGSWKDSERFVQGAWRTSESQNKAHSYIGFRCVRSLAATTTGKRVLMKKK